MTVTILPIKNEIFQDAMEQSTSNRTAAEVLLCMIFKILIP